jgi:hypothetical protein
MEVFVMATDVRYYRVDMIESEAGWGQKVDEKFYFRTQQDAADYVKTYNEKYNNKPTTPSWYIRAEGPHTEYVDPKLLQIILEDVAKGHIVL